MLTHPPLLPHSKPWFERDELRDLKDMATASHESFKEGERKNEKKKIHVYKKIKSLHFAATFELHKERQLPVYL